MPETKTWIMLGLIVFAWFQYTYPTGTVQSIGDATFGKVNEFLKVKGVEVQEKVEDVCPDTINYVCGSDEVTYDNFCKAVVAGTYEVEEGEC